MLDAMTFEFDKILKFGAVGVLNTLIDFAIFNVLSSRRVGLSKIQANLVSTTVAMTFSFFVNKSYVFGANGGNVSLQIAAFLAVTAFGLYVLQNIVIYALTEKWTWPGKTAFAIVKVIGLHKIFNQEFVMKNSAKIAATFVSLTWNYLLYQGVVFKL
jgi:putative flippase GtrA